MQNQPTVLFCVGATKAGTSWLHRYLSDHPDCHMRSIKELHYFDALDGDSIQKQIESNQSVQHDLAARLEGANEIRTANLIRQLGDREHWLEVLQSGDEDIPAYLDYLCGSIADETLVADMTPSYSLLSEDRLNMMAKSTADTRFIYILRDPVARLWSHVRMMASRRSKDGKVERQRADRIFNRVLEGREEQIAMRCDYRAAIEKLRRAVDPSRLLIVFYEELFEGEGLQRICDFLGISSTAGNPGQRVHAGQPLALGDDQRSRARAWLAEQYDYIRNVIGNMPETWQYDLAKVQA